MKANGVLSLLKKAPKVRDPNKFGRKRTGNPEIVKGNTLRLAAKENMSEESHKRRMEGLMRGWGTSERIRKGAKIMTFDKAKRARARLTENVRAEARDIQNLARTHAARAMERIVELIENSEKGSDIIAAVGLLLDRAYGKASQTTVNANLDANGKPTEVTPKELDERIAEALRSIERLTAGEGQQEASQEEPDKLCVGDRDPGNSSVH